MTQETLSKSSREELIEVAIRASRRADAADASKEKSDARLAEVEQQLRWLRNQLFGTKSERRPLADQDPSQLCLGEIVDAPTEVVKLPPTTVRSHQRQKNLRNGEEVEVEEESGLRFDDSIPIKTIHVPNPELDGLPENQLVEIDERISYRLAQEPAAYVVLKFVRRVIKRTDTGKLTCPPALPSVLEKSYADVSVLAGLVIDKFQYHLPLYRQHQRMKAAGVTISRSTLSNWVHRLIELLEPIYMAQLRSILQSKVLAMDETPIRAGRSSKGKMRKAFFWPLYGDRHEVAFPYAPSRAHDHAKTILGEEYRGTLISDGYQAYDEYAARHKDVVHAQCWVHVRRGFIKAEDVEPELCAEAVARIAELYVIEAEIQKKGLEGEAKQMVRGEKSKIIVAEFFAWLDEQLAEHALLPKNPFTRAARYATKRKKDLEVFLSNPDVPMDTNHLERALRVIPMGRKNWMFCWTELGAKKVGQIQSLISTCVLHDIDPYTYLIDVLQRVDSHPQSRVAELTPRLWKDKFGDDPLRSILHRPTP